MNISALIHYYIPEQFIEEKTHEMFSLLLNLLGKEGLDSVVKQAIVDNLFGFISHEDHISLSLRWLSNGHVFENVDHPLHELNKKNKYSILRVMFKSIVIPLSEKNSVLEATLAGD
jgi:hypothetical protein